MWAHLGGYSIHSQHLCASEARNFTCKKRRMWIWQGMEEKLGQEDLGGILSLYRWPPTLGAWLGVLVSQAAGEHFFVCKSPSPIFLLLIMLFLLSYLIAVSLSQLRISAFCLTPTGGGGGGKSSCMWLNFQQGLSHSTWFGNGFKEYCFLTFPSDRDKTCSSSDPLSFHSPRLEFAFFQSSGIYLVLTSFPRYWVTLWCHWMAYSKILAASHQTHSSMSNLFERSLTWSSSIKSLKKNALQEGCENDRARQRHFSEQN